MYEEQNTSSKVFYEKKIKELNYIIERQARDYELRISNLEVDNIIIPSMSIIFIFFHKRKVSMRRPIFAK